MILVELIFLSSLGLLFYIYFGYPLMLMLIGILAPWPVRKGSRFPSASVVIAAYNEEEIIERKLRNTLELTYPRNRLEIVIASDGSTDRTVSIARRYASQGIRVLDLPRRGKAEALNDGVLAATGEVIVFTDANSMLETESLRALVEDLGDPEVGGVCGNQRYRPADSDDVTGREESLYWQYDKAVKGLESRTGSIIAADGSLYAIRRSLYVPIDDPAVADDMAISTRVVLNGHRLVYEARAVTYEDAPARGRQEFLRKVRITNHSVRALLGLGRDLWLSGFYSIKLLSHKLLRHLAPFWLIVLFSSNVLLLGTHPVCVSTWGCQVLFYVLAFLGWRLRETQPGRSRLLSVPYFFCFVNAAALLGVLSVLIGRSVMAWEPRGGIPAAGDPPTPVRQRMHRAG